MGSVVPEIHLFEPSGYGGVFQHACRLGELLHGRGLRVVFHTGHEHEPLHPAGVELCACSWWPRGELRSAGRSARIASRFTARTLPHLQEAVPDGAVLHVQGIAAAGALTLLALGLGRLGDRRVVYSPHDTFSRLGRADGELLRLAQRVPHAVIVHSEADARLLRATGILARYSPLVQLVPAPTQQRHRRWRAEWGADETVDVVLFAGVIRPEKRLDLLVESARSWPSNRRLAVVGEDRGGWDSCATLASDREVDVAARVEFVELDEFAAAISAANVVVAPHDKASQSGVLALARQLGVPTVAASVGGLPELASRTFPAGDVAALTRAIDALLANPGAPRPLVDEDLAVETHLRAYRLDGGHPAGLECRVAPPSRQGQPVEPARSQPTAAPVRVSPLAEILRRWWLVLVITLAAVTASAIALASRAPSYNATATLLVSPLPQYDETFFGTTLVRDSGDATRTGSTVAQLVDTDAVAAATARRLGPSWTARSVRAAVDLKPVGETNLVAVTARGPDRAVVSQLAGTFARSALNVRWRAIRRELDERIAVLNARRQDAVLDPEEFDRQISALDVVRRSGRDPTLRLQSVRQALPARQLSAPVVMVLALLGGLFLGALAAVGLGRRAAARIADE
jgi:glycosyltransferase involved in cell wall biosynthesis/capsular polysaccharide biosynthesis protein